MQMKKCKIFFTSDVHGYFYPTSYGDMKVKPMGLMQCIPDFKKDEDTLIMDGGDILQGSAFAYFCRHSLKSNDVMADIMNDGGYDYFTLGNHDFNYGQDYQKNYINKMNAKCVCENLLDENGKVMYPYDIHVMKNGLRIGIVGIVTDFVNVWEKKENLVGIQVTDPIEAARKALSELKGKTDFNICIYHGGFERDLNTGEMIGRNKENVAYEIAKELDFDVLLTGHQHMSIDGRDLFGTYIVQPMDSGKEYQYLEIDFEDGIKNISSRKVTPDPEKGQSLRDKYQDVENQIQKWLNESAGELDKALLPSDKLDMALNGSPIADFINEIMLYSSGADISVASLANEISGFKKSVSTRDIIATYPYPNTLVVVEMTGAQLKAAMERSAEYFDIDADGNVCISKGFLEPKIEHYNFDFYANVEYKMLPQNPVGQRVVDLKYKGEPVKNEDTFNVCVNNYRFSGAGGYGMYPECKVVREINTEMVELIMEYFEKNLQK